MKFSFYIYGLKLKKNVVTVLKMHRHTFLFSSLFIFLLHVMEIELSAL